MFLFLRRNRIKYVLEMELLKVIALPATSNKSYENLDKYYGETSIRYL